VKSWYFMDMFGENSGLSWDLVNDLQRHLHFI
jgi:hypothetical protein